MATNPGTSAASLPIPPFTNHSRKPQPRSSWLLGISIGVIIVVFVGFSRTYYLKSFFGIPKFPLLFHVHGALFTAWMIVSVLQTYLVASRRVALHRRVGWIGALLAVPVLVTGCMVSLAAARGQGPITSAILRGELKFRVAALDFPPLQAMIIPLTTMLLFGLFAGAGIAFRGRPQTHKRLMMLATIAMLPAAIGRGLGALFGVTSPGLFFGAVGIFIIAMILYDRRTLGRIHAVTLWGGLALMLSFPTRIAFARTDIWIWFAEWLIN